MFWDIFFSFANNFWTSKDKELAMALSYFSHSLGSKNVFFTLKGQGQTLTSGQGHVVTKIGHISRFASMSQTQWSHPQRSMSFQSKVIGKNLFVASNDLGWPFKRLSAKKTPWASRVVQIVVILKYLDSSYAYRRIYRHFHFSPLTYNGKVTPLTWP